MNLMQDVISDIESSQKNQYLLERIKNLKIEIKKKHIKFTKKSILLGNTYYYHNSLPYISEARDVLKKPNVICKMKVNWKIKPSTKISKDELFTELPDQWGWTITTVDAEHQRNKYKNKSISWVIFDSEEKARLNMEIFNKMFITAIEWDAIDEYKKFKKNPEKRPLTFDKIIDKETVYNLYEAVDQGKF